MPTNPPPPLSERLMNCAAARFEQAHAALSPLAALRFAARALYLTECAFEARAAEDEVDFASASEYQNRTRSAGERPPGGFFPIGTGTDLLDRDPNQYAFPNRDSSLLVA